MLIQLSATSATTSTTSSWRASTCGSSSASLAQLLFGSRFVVQWIASERAGRSVMPIAFWFFSIAGGLMTLVYGLVRREPVIIIGQVLSTVIYVRNIVLILRERKRRTSPEP